jgi:hypothetical protein
MRAICGWMGEEKAREAINNHSLSQVETGYAREWLDEREERERGRLREDTILSLAKDANATAEKSAAAADKSVAASRLAAIASFISAAVALAAVLLGK